MQLIKSNEVDRFFDQLPIHSEACDVDYWCNVNLSLIKGYELPVGQQNILDEINGSLSDQFRNKIIDVSDLTHDYFKELVYSVELEPLGLFIGHRGIDHHYHVITGLGSKTFRLDVDLKCIPTVINKFGAVVASLCFISAKLVVGDKVYQDVMIKYIGPKNLENEHLSVIEYGIYATNDQLGKWLRYIRSFQIGTNQELLSIGE